MNYKNCTHYNEIVRVLSENGSLEDINFKIEETKGCECEKNEDSVCELWVTLAFAHDMAPQLGIAHAAQTIENLDNRMKEIATKLVMNVGNKQESIEETEETISETNIDSQLFAALPEEKQQLIEQLLEMGDVTFVESDANRNQRIVKAISTMDIEQLKDLTKDYLSKEDRKDFLKLIRKQFSEFKEKNDTLLIAYSGSCGASWCDNYGTSGYSFAGNNSNTFADLVFATANKECRDICKCYGFDIDDPFINRIRNNERIKLAEKYNFTDEELDSLPF